MKDFFYKNVNALVIGGLVVLVTIFAVLFFTTLGDDKVEPTPNIPSQTQTPTPEPSIDTDPVPGPDVPNPFGLDDDDLQDVYLETIMMAYPEFDGMDEELLVIGEKVCADMSNGATLDDLTNDAVENGIDPGTYGYIVGAASETLCPENSGYFDQYSFEGSNA